MELIRSEDLFATVFGLFDQYMYSQITRREFVDRVSKYAAGGLTAAAILSCLSPNYAKAVRTEPNDKRIRSKYSTYSSPKGAGLIGICFLAAQPPRWGFNRRSQSCWTRSDNQDIVLIHPLS